MVTIRFFLIAWYLVLIVQMMLVCGCDNGSRKNNNLALAELSGDLSLKLPSDSKVYYLEREDRRIDPFWIAKIGISAQGSETFLKELKSKVKDKTQVSSWVYPGKSWWNPQNTKMKKQYAPSENSIAFIVVESTDTDRYNVFVEFFVW